MLGEWKSPRVQETFSSKITFLKRIHTPENCKKQEINRIKSEKINSLCTQATNSLIIS